MSAYIKLSQHLFAVAGLNHTLGNDSILVGEEHDEDTCTKPPDIRDYSENITGVEAFFGAGGGGTQILPFIIGEGHPDFANLPRVGT